MTPADPCAPDLRARLEATLRFVRGSGAWVVPGDRGDVNSGEPVGPVVDRVAALATVREGLGECRRCRLATTRSHLVFGVGSAEARLVFVGEAPGYHEDRRGEPFVGRAGQMLDRMIAALGLTRDEVYITNVLKCRPPDNRDPATDEAAICSAFLWRQLEAIGPEVVCALGAHAARNLLEDDGSIGSTRGKVLRARSWPLVATYHPAYLLRRPGAKAQVWQDIKRVKDLLGTPSGNPSNQESTDGMG